MKLTTNDIRKRFPLVFGWTTSGEVPTRTDFDEWLESHDAEVLRKATQPLIPKGTPGVWASTVDCDVRRVLTLRNDDCISRDRRWRAGTGILYADADLINPVPIPEEVGSDE